MWLVQCGSYGWVNLSQVRSVERREGGALVVHLLGGSELALLPDEAEALVEELEKLGSCRLLAGVGYPTLETRAR